MLLLAIIESNMSTYYTGMLNEIAIYLGENVSYVKQTKYDKKSETLLLNRPKINFLK